MNAPRLNMDRTRILMRNDIRTNLRSLSTGIAAAAGVLLSVDILSMIVGSGLSGRDATFGSILIIGGYIITSLAFTDLHDAKRASHYLTLPGSTLEKYAGRVLLTTVGWTILAAALFMLVTLVSAGIGLVFFRDAGEVFLPVTRLTWQSIGGYVVTQPIFLFGAVYFKKNHLLKTLLAAIVVAFGFAFFSIVALRIAFIGEFAGLLPAGPEMERLFGEISTTANGRFIHVMDIVGNFLYWAFVPLFFWILGYRRMRETEV